MIGIFEDTVEIEDGVNPGGAMIITLHRVQGGGIDVPYIVCFTSSMLNAVVSCHNVP